MSNALKKDSKREGGSKLIINIKFNENSERLKIAYKFLAKKMLEDKECEQEPIQE